MSLILSGTDGLSDVDGSAATPAIRGTDTNTGIFFPAADTVGVATGGSERVRVDSSGNVGIGTASPSCPLNVVSAASSLAIAINGRSSDNLGAMYFYANNGSTQYSTVTASATEFRLSSVPASAVQTFYTNASERMRIDSSGNVGIGTSSPSELLTVTSSSTQVARFKSTSASNNNALVLETSGSASSMNIWMTNSSTNTSSYIRGDSYLSFATNGTNSGGRDSPTERMRIDSSGRVLVGTTSTNLCAGNTEGIGLNTTSNGTLAIGTAQFSSSGNAALNVNRKTDDGGLVTFSQDGTQEGTISVAGTTVSYNGGHLSRWAQTITAKDESLVKGTVLSNLDEMNVYTDAEGNPVQNEQLNKVKVSDVEGDANVAGVFVNWTHDDAHDVDEINMAMTGDMIIRIAQGTTVQRGDLLMSAGDGTAKPQGDDIVRSKTVAKVTSTHVTCTYADGSFCVPCVLMAC